MSGTFHIFFVTHFFLNTLSFHNFGPLKNAHGHSACKAKLAPHVHKNYQFVKTASRGTGQDLGNMRRLVWRLPYADPCSIVTHSQ